MEKLLEKYDRGFLLHLIDLTFIKMAKRESHGLYSTSVLDLARKNKVVTRNTNYAELTIRKSHRSRVIVGNQEDGMNVMNFLDPQIAYRIEIRNGNGHTRFEWSFKEDELEGILEAII